MFQALNPNDRDSFERFRSMTVPQIDHQIRQAISYCWMTLPVERRNVEELEREIRRLVDRAIRDFREDNTSFGIQ